MTNRKNDKAVKIMIKTNFILKSNRRLRVRVRVCFILFHYELTVPRCHMLQTLLGRKKYEGEISDEQLYYEQCHSLKDLS